MTNQRKRRCDPQKQAYWEDVLRQWRASGQTVRDYCRQAGVPESALYFWRGELARRGQSSGVVRDPSPKTSPVIPAARAPQRRSRSRQSTPSFLPVRVVEDAPAEVARVVEIVLAQGHTVRVPTGFDRQTLADVLAVLEARPC